MRNRDKTETGLGRRDLFRTTGTIALGGLLVATLPQPIIRVAHASSDHGETDAERLVIELGELFFRVEGGEDNAPIELHADEEYEIVFRNIGTAPHEVMIGREVDDDDGRPHGYETDLLDTEEVMYLGDGWEIEASGLREVELEPGAEVRLRVTVPREKAGEWEIGCFLPGHYEGGMKAPLFVEGRVA